MIEASVTIAIAVMTGLGFVVSKSQARMLELDKRIDAIELRVAEKYVPREELSASLTRFEEHMVRIENKLDRLIIK